MHRHLAHLDPRQGPRPTVLRGTRQETPQGTLQEVLR